MFRLNLQKEIISNIRSFFRTTMETLDLVQNQTERVIDFFCSQGAGFQEEYLKVLKEWLERTRDMREEFMKMTEDYLISIEKTVLSGDEAKAGEDTDDKGGAKPKNGGSQTT